MKNIIAILICGAIAHLTFAQNGLGVGTTNPSQKLDVAGWIEIGNQSQGSSASAGVIRYNTAGYLQFHNGSAWVDVLPKTVFTRWGRDDCPSGSSLVYWGYTAGAWYNHSGSGGNALCLTSSPSWSGASYSDSRQYGALVYGAEYQTSGYGLSSIVNRHDYDPRCAVCMVTNAYETLIVPGTYNCPSGYTRQYWGYLMANHYTQYPSEYICLDNNPEIHGTNADQNGTLWYPTETELGSLTSPYVQNRELNCAVCTQ